MIQGFVDAAYQGTFHEPLPLAGRRRAPVARSRSATREAVARLTRSTGLDIHAGERETSLIMRWFPETLAKDVDVAGLKRRPGDRAGVPGGRGRRDDGGSCRREGHIGDPAAATPENGELYAFEAADMADALADFLRPANERGHRRPRNKAQKSRRPSRCRDGLLKLCVALRPRRRRRKASVGYPTTKGESHLRSNGRRAILGMLSMGPPPFHA